MRHLSDGTLRRWRDDAFAASNRERDHLAGCRRCTQRAAAIGADADVSGHLFAAAASGPAAAAEPALTRLRQRLASGGEPAQRDPLPPPRARRRWVMGGAVAAPVVAAGLLVTANAAGWLTIFAPTQVAPVVLTASSVSGLPDLSGYGRMQVTEPTMTTVTGASEAAAASGLRLLVPGTLPATVPGSVQWEVVGHGHATFTLDQAAADAAATRAGRAAPVVPTALQNTSISVDGGPAVVAVYGAVPTGRESALPALVIAQGVRPTAATTGATLRQVEDFLLAQPGVSTQLAAAIRAIGEPGSTLPIPVISGLMTSQTITIDGVQGVVAGDSTGLGAAVIWEKDGIVYAVGGTLPQSEVVDIARSLH